ncbi:hypothetical protein STEG23_004259, partial [Scotinomys teguina]
TGTSLSVDEFMNGNWTCELYRWKSIRLLRKMKEQEFSAGEDKRRGKFDDTKINGFSVVSVDFSN